MPGVKAMSNNDRNKVVGCVSMKFITKNVSSNSSFQVSLFMM